MGQSVAFSDPGFGRGHGEDEQQRPGSCGRLRKDAEMVSKSYLPTKDADLLTWSNNASSILTPSPTDFGLDAATLTAFNAAIAAYSTALTAAQPSVRNKSATVTKSEKKQLLKQNIRAWVATVDATATVTDAQRTDLGLNVRKPPTPAPAPTTAPVVEVLGVSGFTVTVRLRSAVTGMLRGKPAFVVGASLFSFTGEAPPSDISQWKFEGNTGKPKFAVQFPNTLAKGTTVWFTAFWFNGAKISGPMTTPISTVLQGGTVTMGEAKTA